MCHCQQAVGILRTPYGTGLRAVRVVAKMQPPGMLDEEVFHSRSALLVVLDAHTSGTSMALHEINVPPCMLGLLAELVAGQCGD